MIYLINIKIYINPTIGDSRVKYSEPLKAIKYPVTDNTEFIAFRIIGNVKTKIRAKMMIR